MSENATMGWNKKEPTEAYTQMCVWPSTIVGQDDVDNGKLQDFFKDTFGLENPIEVVGCVTTLPDKEHRHMEDPPTGGRIDFVFFVHGADIGRFAVPRLEYGIRWWEDVCLNNAHEVYPSEFLAYGKSVYAWDDSPFFYEDDYPKEEE